MEISSKRAKHNFLLVIHIEKLFVLYISKKWIYYTPLRSITLQKYGRKQVLKVVISSQSANCIQKSSWFKIHLWPCILVPVKSWIAAYWTNLAFVHIRISNTSCFIIRKCTWKETNFHAHILVVFIQVPCERCFYLYIYYPCNQSIVSIEVFPIQLWG